MKKYLLSFKIFCVVYFALALFCCDNVCAQSVNITIPATILVYGQGTSFTTSATSNNGFYTLGSIKFSVDGGAAITATITGNKGAASISTTGLTAGVHTLVATATYTFLGFTVDTETDSYTFYVITASGGSACAPGQAILTATGAPSGGTYKWYAGLTGGAAIGTGASFTTPTISTATTYYVDVLYNSVENSRIPVVATIGSAPTITTQPVATSVCVGNTTSFSVAASGVGPLTYQWEYNGFNFPTDGTDGNGTYSGTQTATLNLTPGNTYYNTDAIKCAVSNSCGGIYSNSVTLTVNPLPTAAFTVSPSTVGIGSPTTVTLTGGVVSGYTYTWSFDTGASPATGTGAGPGMVSWSTLGSKTLTLTVKNNTTGCSTTVTQTVQVVAAQLTGYAFSKPLVLNTSQIRVGTTHTGISATTPLVNFPALVYIKDDALKIDTVCNNRVQYPYGNYNGITAGTNYDFAFTLATNPGAELNYQVDTYDQQDGILLVWVQIPSMTSTNVNLDFYFGNPAPAGHGVTFTQNTWASDYLAVYHFNEGANTVPVLDATSNKRNAAQTGTTITNDEIHSAAGIPITGGAYSFDGSTTQIIQNSGTNPDATGKFTESAWVYASNVTADNKIMSNQSNYGPGYKLSVNTDVVTETRPTLYDYTAGAVTAGTWNYIQGIYDGNHHFLNYVNGVLAGTSSNNTASAAGTGSVLSLGLDYNTSQNTPHYYTGSMDEVRVSNVVKSADWIRAEYFNQSNPLTFTDYSGDVATYQTTAASIPGALTYTWTGATSTDPSDASNWNNTTSGVTGQAPVSGTSTLVIPVSTKYPSLTSDLSIYGLTLTGSANITLNGHILNVACNIYNQSTGHVYWSNNDASGITWNGTSAQSYNGNTGTSGYAHLGTMTVNNSGGATVTINNDSLDVYHELTITKGNLAVAPGGFMALKSSQSETANVDAIPSPYVISGNVNVERYITGGSAGYRGYRFLSSPVNISGLTDQLGTQANVDLSYLTSGMITGGPTGIGGGFTLTTTNPLIYLFDETRLVNHLAYSGGENVGVNSMVGASASPAYSITTLTPALAVNSPAMVPVGNAYLVYYVGNTASGDVLTTPSPHASTVTAVGTLNQGTIPVHISNGTGLTSSTVMSYTSILTTGAATPGLHQIGNPYPSTIDLNQFYTDNAGNITSIIDELKEPNGAYVAYDASNGHTSATTAGQYIVSGQGFFVHANGTGKTLTFKEDEKVSTQLVSGGTPPLLLNQKAKNTNTMSANVFPLAADAGLHMQISKDSSIYTQTGIYFNSTGSDNYSPNEDAVDMDGTSVYLSSYSADNKRLSINELGDYSKGKVVKLYVSAASYGAYKLSLADINNIDSTTYNLYLRDHYLKDSINLYQNKTYNFNVLSDTASYGANRFDLVVELKNFPPYALINFTGQKLTSGVALKWDVQNAGNYTGFILQKKNSNNTFTAIDSLQSNSSISNYSYTDKNPVIGNNVYRLAQNNIYGNITYSSLVTIGYDGVSSSGYFSVYPNPAKDIINILVNSTTATAANYTADIYNTSGVMIDHRILNTYTWTEDVSKYKEGVYIIALKNMNGDVLAKSKFIKTR